MTDEGKAFSFGKRRAGVLGHGADRGQKQPTLIDYFTQFAISLKECVVRFAAVLRFDLVRTGLARAHFQRMWASSRRVKFGARHAVAIVGTPKQS